MTSALIAIPHASRFARAGFLLVMAMRVLLTVAILAVAHAQNIVPAFVADVPTTVTWNALVAANRE